MCGVQVWIEFTMLMLWAHRHAETDSPTYSWMNSNFFIISRNTVGSTGIVFTIFRALNSTLSA